MEISSLIREALKLLSSAYLISTVLMLFLPDPFKIKSTMWQLLVQQIAIYLETSVVSFYWEQKSSFVSARISWGSPVENSDLLSQQLSSPMVNHVDLRLHEAFYDFQLCSWSARTVASLTARSCDEDRFGVARFTGCNAAVVSTLLSCLLAVEACLGKKTNPQSPHLLSPTNIWRKRVTLEKEILCVKRESTLHEKAYGIADVLGASIYQIVSAFHDEMQKGAKAGILDKDWIIKSKPLHGTREISCTQAEPFLDLRAN